jgi:GT2 family glycosyltransferase
MKISVIIVHWNTVDHLKNLLSRLDDGSMETIVIDNNSSEKIDELQIKYKQVTFIKNAVNHGYAMACNQGAAIAKGEWLLFLNPDVEVTPDQVMMMIEQAEEKNFVACSPKPVSKDYQKTVPTVWSLLEEFTPLNKLMTNTGKVYTLTGGCLLIKSEILRKLGGWDERFFLWFEDSDLTKRLIDNNYKIGWIETEIKHLGGVSFKKLDSQQKRDIFFHSMDIYARKHFSFWGKLIISFLKKRYTKRKVLPTLQEGVSITVPNMNLSILQKFFEDNSKFLNKIDELIIVTSAIKNDDVWDWRKKHPQVRFILLQKNNGVASTINVGLRASATKWIGTVNDDTILSNDWIEKCLECNAKDVGVLNPIIYHPTGEMESAGVKVLKKQERDHKKELKPMPRKRFGRLMKLLLMPL